MNAYDTVIAALALMGLIVLGWVVSFGSSEFHTNPAQMELKLQANAKAALAEAGHDWAKVEFNGQNATVFGAPVSAEAEADAIETVRTSSGKGGLLWGGVLSVQPAFDDVVEIPQVATFEWRAVKAPAGDITLVGHVPSLDARGTLNTVAAVIAGDRVTDRLELVRGDIPIDWADIATFSLEQLDLIDSGEARLTQTNLRLSGVALDDTARIRVVSEVSNLTDPWSGIAKLRGPSHWTAEHIGGELILSGRVETESLKTELSQIANQYFNGTVIDQMTVEVSEYEDWADGVKAGLPHFTQFQSGEMAFDPKGLGYVFEGEATASTLQYLKEDMALVETSYASEIEVVPVAVTLDELDGVDLGDTPLETCQSSFDLVMAANKVYFDTGNAVITRQSGLTLDKILTVAETCDPILVFELGGHTDSSGDPEANLGLSEARAGAVANYLRDAGFDRDRLIVRGYGSSQPAADNSTPEGRAANRRIEFKVQERSE